jgi:hypothetical protein
LFANETNADNGSEIRAGSASWGPGTAVAGMRKGRDWDTATPDLDYDGSGEQFPVPVVLRGHVNGGRGRPIGTAKYLYSWTTQTPLTRLDSDTSGAGLLVVRNGSNASVVVPWDPTVNPK